MITRLLLIAILSSIGFSAHAERLNLTRVFVARCGGILKNSENTMENMRCASYFQGIEDAIRMQESTNRMVHNKEAFCVPRDYTTRMGMERLLQMIHREPSMLNQELALMVKLMFVETFPCATVAPKAPQAEKPTQPLPVPIKPRNNNNRQFQF